jgi:metal iron transporter
MIALIPATVVAAVVGKEGINALLVASQFILSLVLPFVVLPLVWLTSNERVMSVPIPPTTTCQDEAQQNKECPEPIMENGSGSDQSADNIDLEASEKPASSNPTKVIPGPEKVTGAPLAVQGTPMMKSYKNGRPLMVLGYFIFVCILAADTIAIISLARGS